MIVREAREITVVPVVGAHVAHMSEIELIAADQSDDQSGAHAGALRVPARVLAHGAVGLGEGIVEHRDRIIVSSMALHGRTDALDGKR
jgi:hypothetical protein